MMTDEQFESDDQKAAPWDDAGGRGDGRRLVVDLDGYEGPLDMLLALARQQKVDLARISILQLADQYVDYLDCCCPTRLATRNRVARSSPPPCRSNCAAWKPCAPSG